MLRREAGEGIRPVAGNHLLAPNEYIITLGMHDYQEVGADPDLTSDAFAKHLAGYIGEQGWQTYGDVVVRFERSANLHTGQFRTRGAVNPDVEPRRTAGELAPPQSDHAFSAEPGVPAMTDNSSYRGGPGHGRPGDDSYDDPYAHPQDDPHAARRSRAVRTRRSRAATPSSAAAATPTKPATTSAAATPTRPATASAAATRNSVVATTKPATTSEPAGQATTSPATTSARVTARVATTSAAAIPTSAAADKATTRITGRAATTSPPDRVTANTARARPATRKPATAPPSNAAATPNKPATTRATAVDRDTAGRITVSSPSTAVTARLPVRVTARPRAADMPNPAATTTTASPQRPAATDRAAMGRVATPRPAPP